MDYKENISRIDNTQIQSILLDYLNSNLIPNGKIETKRKKNGHLGIQGDWQLKNKNGHISVYANNETFIVGNIKVLDECSKYHYLQTYEHIPRGEPDKNGYYARSTEEEIIKYLDYYLVKLLSF